MASIGEALKQARESRALSLQDVHDATRITPQNLSALEEDRFDSFPNRVYARAFLRDYANYLGLDSAGLLAQYEEEWHREPETESARPRKKGSFARRLGYSLLVLALMGALGAGAYFSWKAFGHRPSVGMGTRAPVGERDVAQLPKAHVPSGNELAPKPEKPKQPEAKPVPPTPPPPPDKLTLRVTTTRPVWVEVRTDGTTAAYATLPPGTKTFEAKKKIYIKVGQADGVKLKLNDGPEKLMGDKAVKAEETFVLPEQPTTTPQPAAPPAQPAAGQG